MRLPSCFQDLPPTSPMTQSAWYRQLREPIYWVGGSSVNVFTSSRASSRPYTYGRSGRSSSSKPARPAYAGIH
jgi:hypothetical protein